MPKTSQELGLWIKENKDRKGSPDFNKVVQAWKKAKERETNPYFNSGQNAYKSPSNTNDDKSGLGDALEHSFLRAREGSLGYIADVRDASQNSFLQKGFDYLGEKTDKVFDPIRNKFGMDTGEQLRKDRVVKEDAEIADTRKTSEEMGKQADALNYKGWSYKDVEGLGDVIPYALNKIVESVPYITSGPALLMTAIMPGELNQTLKEIEGLPEEKRLKLAATGGAIMGALDVLGIGAIFNGVNKSVIGALDKKGVAAILTKRGVAPNIIKNFVKGGLGESVTETGQEITSMVTETLGGAKINKRQAKDRILEAAIGGFTVGSSIRTTLGAASDTKNLFTQQANPLETNNGKIRLKSQKNMTERDAAAFTAFANRLRKSADLNQTNFKDVNKMSTKGPRELIDRNHKNLVGEIKNKFRDIKPLIRPEDGKTFEDIKERVYANVAVEMARNKTKNVVGQENYLALESLVGDLKEGQELVGLLEESDVLTHVHNNGYQGGLSSFTDNFKIFGSTTGYDRGQANLEKVLRPGASTVGAITTGGASIIPQLTLPPLGRAIDKATGNYSKVEKFIRQNEDKGFLRPDLGLPSVVEKGKVKEQRKALDDAIAKLRTKGSEIALREENINLFNENVDATPGSPQAVLEEALGARDSDKTNNYVPVEEINAGTLIKLLEDVKKQDNSRIASNEIKVIADRHTNEMIKSIKEGGKVSDNALSNVIRKVVSMAKKQGIIKRRTAENSPGPANTQLETPAIARGIEDNKKVLAELTNRAKTNSSVEPYRAPLEKALNSLGLNLGVDPESAANEIVETAKAEGVPNKAVKSYLKPYVDRIVRQQYSKKPNEFQGEQNPSKVREARVMPIPNKKSYLADFTVKVNVDPEVFDGEKTGTKGRYIDRDTGADLTGKTFAGANINTIDGPGNMETSDTEVEVSDERIPGAYTYRANLIQNRNGKKWSWVNNNTNQITHEEGIVSVQGGKDSKHFYTFDYQIETPVTLDAVKTGQVENSVVLKPKTKGNMVLGNELGKIKVPGGGIHTVYDNIRIEPMETDSVPTPGRVAESKLPALTNINEPLKGTGKKGSITISDVVSHLQTKAEAEGKKAPRTLSGGKETNKVDYTPEVKDRIYNDIKNEVLGFKEQKPDSLYWYTFGSPIAMDMMTSVIPQLDPQHSHPDAGQPLRMLFWALISPLSGGQNPVANAKLAIDVMRGYIDTGRIPLHKYQGGLFINDETVAEREAAGGKLAWTPRGRTTENALAAIQNGIDQTGSLENFMIWMTSPHPIQEVRDAYESYGFGTLKRNKDGSYAANLGSMSDAYADADGMVYGSQVLGPKFGPFMLNNTGNEIKTTKDEWFTRGWNRIIGRLYAPNGDILSQPADANERAIQDEIIVQIAGDLGYEPAQIQALWWAYEQNLYTDLGVDSPTRDYIDAAKEAIKAVSGEAQAIEREREGRARFSELSAQEATRRQGPENLTRQSRGPALTSPEGNQPRTNPPSIRRLKPYVEPTKKVFEIGKPGGDLEDGIGTLGEALEMARGLNLTVTLLNEMPEGTTGEYAGMADVKGADGLIRSTTKGNVRVLKQGANHPMFNGAVRSVEEFTSLMHEIAHGLAIQRVDRVPSAEYREAKNPFVLAEQALESVKVGSFEDFILDAIENHGRENEVLQEIANLQENIDVEIARRPELGTTGVRPLRQVAEHIKANPALRSRIDDTKLQEINNQFRRTYLRTVSEMAVDPLWVYFINPKLIKKVAPQTARAIREVFNKMGGNNPVTFYSYPLATIMAIVMGVLANMEQEEEERLRQPPPPPGALSPQMGALSA